MSRKSKIPEFPRDKSLADFESGLLESTLSEVRNLRRRRTGWRVAGSTLTLAFAISWFSLLERPASDSLVERGETEHADVTGAERPLITRTGNLAEIDRWIFVPPKERDLISLTRSSPLSNRITRSSDPELFAFLDGYRFILIPSGKGQPDASLELLH
ncbi:MAG: hypothetical protein AAGC68_15805 [Verrucomicrobiota bacterium]